MRSNVKVIGKLSGDGMRVDWSRCGDHLVDTGGFYGTDLH